MGITTPAALTHAREREEREERVSTEYSMILFIVKGLRSGKEYGDIILSEYCVSLK